MNNSNITPIVFIVDDDEAVLDSTSLLLNSAGYKTHIFSSAHDFFQHYKQDMEGCLILDVKMPGMDGLELQQLLNELSHPLPIIFISGHGDVPMAVQAMKEGAFQFLQKPFDDDQLLSIITLALEKETKIREDYRRQNETKVLFDNLTPRELEVMQEVVQGKPNKVIAIDLELSKRTVEIHRANLMHKLRVKSLAELINLVKDHHTNT